ncbi:uncharacterized protein LOC113275878 isoform X2 [Papaver somniferum]|uniref:uncharacterized protein LOC113275878 isoform X2 n=1 Tax=Papaver somniferum TaxID=3469 RepID=UPI000E6FC2FF|nr:uncharacterized protein LOC113275878 isoform X2 [Papaver somniferum]
MRSTSSPSRSPTKNNNKEERPRFFDAKAKSLCWAKADVLIGRHPERWRKDAAGNIVCKRFCNCQGCLCFEYDHIIPFSKGGESTVENCQILQTRVNRYKSDNDKLEKSELEGFSCDIKFTDAWCFELIVLLVAAVSPMGIFMLELGTSGILQRLTMFTYSMS